METNNLGSKKMNGVQKNNEESKGKNVSHDVESSDVKMKKEVVIGTDGQQEIVERARNINGETKHISKEVDADNVNANRGVSTENQARKTVENKDRNSDIMPNRYPNSHPDNHEDRGNMKLDE